MCSNTLSVLNYYLDFLTEKSTKKLSANKLRIEKEKEVRHYIELGVENPLFADVMISFWTPYKKLLSLKANLKVSKKLSVCRC